MVGSSISTSGFRDVLNEDSKLAGFIVEPWQKSRTDGFNNCASRSIWAMLLAMLETVGTSTSGWCVFRAALWGKSQFRGLEDFRSQIFCAGLLLVSRIWGRSDTKAWFSFALYFLVSGIGQLTKSERTDKWALVGSKGLDMLIVSGARFPNSASKVSWVFAGCSWILVVVADKNMLLNFIPSIRLLAKNSVNNVFITIHFRISRLVEVLFNSKTAQ